MSNPESNSNEVINTQDTVEEEQNVNAQEGDEDEFSYGNDDDDDDFNVDQQAGSSSYPSFETVSTGGTDDPFFYSILSMINTCQAYYVGFYFEKYLGSKITFKIPTSILPLSVSVFNGFNQTENLAEISFEPSRENPWAFYPYFFEAKNDIYGKSFPGSILIQNQVHAFFGS